MNDIVSDLILTNTPSVKDIDRQLLIIRYNNPNMLGAIRSYVRSWKGKQAESYIPPFIAMDIFVNIQYQGNDGEKPWARIIYECTKDNKALDAIKRFPDAMVVTILGDNPKVLQKVIGGRQYE